MGAYSSIVIGKRNQRIRVDLSCDEGARRPKLSETSHCLIRLVYVSDQIITGVGLRSVPIINERSIMTFWPDKRFWRIALLLLVVALPLYYFMRTGASEAKYITTQVRRGPIVRSVIATGTVNPVITVQVGSYVSGPITAIYADFNAPVKAGQLIAKIDPRPFQVKVDESAAALANAQALLGKDQADMAYKQITYQRNKRLFE